MAVGAEVGNHGCDRREVANADKSNRRYGDHVGFVSPPCAVGPCRYPPFFYAPGVATTVSDNVTFANGAVAATPAPPTKRARTEGQFQFLGADGRAKQRKLDVDPVANPHAEVTALRADLERALQPPPRPTAEPEDVESCCYGDNGDDLGGAGEEVGSEPATA
ncbi:hypothetical protein E2562_020256 [Oryza meyeriana var. granulata]|uniref:Uncharacterized protein n=1 Tax=Oryza meyeriana var. granulata TaxID=110450 RepID=A0A6G1DL38_9ORYZ|nr:hypothetical protein E2562_020256 [Oryza meyeriana var. granulata]